MLNLHEDILEEFASFATTTEDLPTFYKAALRDRKIWSWDPPPPTPRQRVCRVYARVCARVWARVWDRVRVLP